MPSTSACPGVSDASSNRRRVRVCARVRFVCVLCALCARRDTYGLRVLGLVLLRLRQRLRDERECHDERRDVEYGAYERGQRVGVACEQTEREVVSRGKSANDTGNEAREGEGGP